MAQSISTSVPRTDYVVPRMEPLPKSRAMWKRTLDVVLASALLILFLPLFLVIALLVKLTSRGPCLYKAQRIGLGGVPFYNLKFRSMRADADRHIAEVWGSNDKEGPFFKVKSDPRITPIGHFIRRYSLDEMPQLWNVLRGEVSLVGPRALHDYEICNLDAASLERLRIKPGITCYWQVQGRSNLSDDERMALDRRYIDDMSLMTDLKILLRTPAAVLRGEGAY